MPRKIERAATSVKVPEHIMQIWEELSAKTGLTKVAVLMVALRQMAKMEGMEIKAVAEWAEVEAEKEVAKRLAVEAYWRNKESKP